MKAFRGSRVDKIFKNNPGKRISLSEETRKKFPPGTVVKATGDKDALIVYMVTQKLLS